MPTLLTNFRPTVAFLLVSIITLLLHVANVEGAGIAGSWKTTYSEMTFPNVTSGNVRAPYKLDNGRIIGTINGHILAGYWVEKGSAQKCKTLKDGSYYWGRINYTFNADFTKFNGMWGYCNKPTKQKWAGTIIKSTADSGSSDAVSKTLDKKCNNLREYVRNKAGGIRVSKQEYIKFLQTVEKRNPGKNWKQILAALHSAAYGDDLYRTLPMTNIPLFQQGAETNGWRNVDLYCGVIINNNFKPNPPKFVYTDNGKMIDIGHAYAGLRSNLNRSVPGWTAFMRGANTYIGDMWQVSLGSPSSYPMWQFRGNLLSLWLSRYYSQAENQNKKLSEAFSVFFNRVKTYTRNKRHQ